MKHFALLVTAVLLMLAPQTLRAHDYRDDAVSFTIPADFAFQPLSATGYQGFTAGKGALKLTLFHLSVTEKISHNKCLSVPHFKWIPSLEKITPIAEERPAWDRYDIVTTYRNSGKGYVRVYRYISKRDICFLLAENSEDSWDEVEQIARSQRFNRRTGHFFYKAGNYFRSNFMYIVFAMVIIWTLRNTVLKFRHRHYLLYLLLLAAAGACAVLFLPWGGLTARLYLAVFVLWLYSCNYHGDADSESPDDNSSSGGYDGTGTTIDYDL